MKHLVNPDKVSYLFVISIIKEIYKYEGEISDFEVKDSRFYLNHFDSHRDSHTATNTKTGHSTLFFSSLQRVD